MNTALRGSIGASTPRKGGSGMTAIEPVDSFLLPTSSAPPPSLDFSDMRDSIKVFLRTFNAYITHACAEIEGSKRDHDATKVEESEKEKTLARDIADAKVAQKELWDAIASERSEDSSQRSRLQALQSQRTSLTQRTSELQTELSETQAKLEARRADKRALRSKLEAQVAKNAPELEILQNRLGCTVGRPDQSDGEQIRFTFTLLDPENHSAEGSFTLNVSKPSYSLSEHSPMLPAEVLDPLLSDLNKTRGFYTFAKRMRLALRDEIVRLRIEKGTAT